MGLRVMDDWRRKRALALATFAPDGEKAGGFTLPDMAAVLRHLPRLALTAALSSLFLWLLSQRLAEVDMAAVGQAVAQTSLGSWAAAAVLTAIAYWAVGQYDVLLHRHLSTQVDAPRARMAGMSAIAVSQVLGLGLVTGAVLRWRMLPEHSLWLASRITLAVALSFLAGWAVVTALAVLALAPPQFAPLPYQAAALAVLILFGLGVGLSIWRPLGAVRWPNGFVIFGLLGLCAIDTLAAAGALYVMLPQGFASFGAGTFAAFLPAFLLAYGAGLISGTPGGIGAFELTLLALLPAQASGPILAAVIGWRLIYYVLPALMGAGIAMRGPRPCGQASLPKTYSNLSLWAAQAPVSHGPIPAEIGLMRQGQHVILAQPMGASGACAQMASARGHVLVAMFDPLCAPRAPALASALDLTLRRAAAAGLWPALYKVGARTASAARVKGWRCFPIAREAVIPCASYDVSAPARANLRRKLRRAAASGVVVQPLAPQDLPFDALAAINADWAQRHGGERGFSMGQFEPAYIAQQKIYAAYCGGVLTAFITLHCGAGLDGRVREWTLDLMRHGPEITDGTMHALLHRAIMDAKDQSIAQVSLAAVPQWAFGPRRFGILACLLRWAGSQGLRQFKDCFVPIWQPRYLCAPHDAGLVLAALSIWRAVRFGGNQGGASPNTAANFCPKSA